MANSGGVAVRATARRLVSRYADTCFVPPSPELKAKWDQELNRARNRKSFAAEALGLQRKPRYLGFDDGVIVPPEEFPFGTSLAIVRSAAMDRAPLRGSVRVIVILCGFSDHAMAATASHFQDLFFSTGVLPHGSVKEYYTEVTNGLVTLTGAVVGPFQMPQTLAWYANDNYGIGKGGGAFRTPQLARDAAVAADPTVNFQPYDNDGNGYVDAFIVVHAGAGAEVTGSSGDIWSHKATMSSVYNTDNTKIYGYLTIPEDAKIGVCAHELGHLLFGFPDLYDTDYTSEGIGNWCLMSGGSWNGGGDVPAHASAWCKANQGWASVTNVTTNGSVTIPDVKASHNVLRLSKDATAGQEYFLVENRQKTGFDADLPGDGLLVWHIDESQSGNTDENHYEVGLLQADAKRDMELGHNRGDAGDPYPGQREQHGHFGDDDAEHQVVRRAGHLRLADEHLGLRADDDGDGHGSLRRQGRREGHQGREGHPQGHQGHQGGQGDQGDLQGLQGRPEGLPQGRQGDLQGLQGQQGRRVKELRGRRTPRSSASRPAGWRRRRRRLHQRPGRPARGARGPRVGDRAGRRRSRPAVHRPGAPARPARWPAGSRSIHVGPGCPDGGR